MATSDEILKRYNLLTPVLDERSRRLLVAAEALALGHGGQTLVSQATGVSRSTIAQGIKELQHPQPLRDKRIRNAGGGRKKVVEQDPSLKVDLEHLIEPVTRGDPESPLRWTCKSIRQLADELKRMGHHTSHRMVAELLHEMKYSLQGNRKTKEGSAHPDRNGQFEHINQQVQDYLRNNQPVISVDAKKRELVGDFKNGGRELRPKGDPEEVRIYDFLIPELGKATPYGIYDVANNMGWVNVGMDHNTSTFAVESIRRWWNSMGNELYPQAEQLLITADGGGSNGSRVRLWKLELQKLSNDIGIPITVCHFPPGTSKWNKIEHSLFSYISQNWRGKPLISYEVIVSLIAATKTRTGLQVLCELDNSKYPTGIKVSDEEIAAICLQRDPFHGEWNYTLSPQAV